MTACREQTRYKNGRVTTRAKRNGIQYRGKLPCRTSKVREGHSVDNRPGPDTELLDENFPGIRTGNY